MARTAARQRVRSAVFDGHTLAVGMPDVAPHGQVNVYMPSEVGSWSSQELRGADVVYTTADTADFGRALALDNGQLLIGAPGDADGAGVVHGYEREATQWSVASEVSAPSDVVAGFGQAPAVHGDLAVATGSGTDHDLVVAFNRGEPVATLEDTGLSPDHQFGFWLALNGDHLVVTGRYAAGEGDGDYVYLYRHDQGTDWVTAPQVISGGSYDFLGYRSSLSGHVVAVSANGLDTGGVQNAGGVLIRYLGP